MKQSTLRKRTPGDWALGVVTSSRAGLLASIITILIGAVVLAAVVRAYNHEPDRAVGSTRTWPGPPPTQSTSPAKSGRALSRLSFQPEANKMRRRLGQRFVLSGREVTASIGMLSVGSNRQPIRIVRTLDDEQGEQVSITVGAPPASLAWSPNAGAVSKDHTLTSNERAIIERIALDSPDQFILAQTRGASYYTIARAVQAAEAADSDASGALWDLIRLAEPQQGHFNNPENTWRIYYINNDTDLIDRIVYQEQLETVTVELADWASRAGEFSPGLIRWTRGKEVVMELSLTNVAYGPRE
jgi:hypothetical protein